MTHPHCPGCKRLATEHHCKSAQCDWLKCKHCSITWSASNGSWFNRADLRKGIPATSGKLGDTPPTASGTQEAA